jgi:hypothetical protein
MPLLIDGYNFLHMLGWIESRRGPKALEQARWRLVRFLASVLSPAQRAETTVVFDAAEPPPLAARTLQAEGITVRFAVEYRSADDLLEDLIQAAPSPRSYVVVSSDRRVQRAALRRQMKALDCWTWYEGLVSKRPSGSRPPGIAESRPAWTHLPLSGSEVERWVRTFYGPEQPPFSAPEELPLSGQEPRETGGAKKSSRKTSSSGGSPKSPWPTASAEEKFLAEKLPDLFDSPFPAGYGEDVEYEEDLEKGLGEQRKE